MPQFKRKPTIIEATRWDGNALQGVTRINDQGHASATGFVTTLQGQHVLIHVGEWVVTESDGIHHYPIADAEFRHLYDPA